MSEPKNETDGPPKEDNQSRKKIKLLKIHQKIHLSPFLKMVLLEKENLNKNSLKPKKNHQKKKKRSYINRKKILKASIPTRYKTSNISKCKKTCK